MVRTLYAAKGKRKSAEVICLSENDLTLPASRRELCYVTTSDGDLFTCPYKETCVREAKSETDVD